MDGPSILASTLERPGKPDKYGNSWQYHPRSDRHSKIACWGILFDALQHSSQLRRHVEAGKVVFGVNKEIRDFRTNRKKDLDLVLATPATEVPLGHAPQTLPDLALRWGIRLTPDQQRTLLDLPPIVEGSTGVVLAALEAKACMTAQIRALPRLFDELNSSQATVHANTDGALAIGFAMVNISDHFTSPDMNKVDLSWTRPVVSQEPQPRSARRAVDKLRELPRRTSRMHDGFDAFGIIVIDMANDGSAITVVSDPPAPAASDVYAYEQMIRRFIHLYDTSYATLT